MTKAGGSLPHGRRTRDEVPPVPDAPTLSELEQRAQTALRRLVEDSGGRFDPASAVPPQHLDLIGTLFHEWAVRHGERSGDGVFFTGRPGLWHALDHLYPLQDPNRWDHLRLATIRHLENRGWQRRTPPRGSAFDIPLTAP